MNGADKTYRTIAMARAEGKLPQAALLQFRGNSLIAKAIQVAGRGAYSHSAMCVYWDGDPYCCESRELRGCRAVTLKSQVDRYPAMIDVYEPSIGLQGEHAARFMRRLAGMDYGYWGVARAALLHAPLLRAWFQPPADASDVWDNRPPFCSQAVSMAFRHAGADPVPNLHDRLTEPSDLTQSSFFTYTCTLIKG